MAQHDYETEHSDDNTDVSREIITSRSWLATIRGNKKIGGYQFRFAFKLFNIAQISHNPPWCTFFSSKKSRPWQDSNLQSPDPKSGALSIRPHGLSWVPGNGKLAHLCVLQHSNFLIFLIFAVVQHTRFFKMQQRRPICHCKVNSIFTLPFFELKAIIDQQFCQL